jgi:hypothetical protein
MKCMDFFKRNVWIYAGAEVRTPFIQLIHLKDEISITRLLDKKKKLNKFQVNKKILQKSQFF